MNNLNHAIQLYKESARVQSLRISYLLAEDKKEKQAIKISLLNLGYNINDNVGFSS